MLHGRAKPLERRGLEQRATVNPRAGLFDDPRGNEADGRVVLVFRPSVAHASASAWLMVCINSGSKKLAL
jgi:hypothetical protein